MSGLTVSNLSIDFQIGEAWQSAVNDVSFELRPGEILGLVGESGCGKSTVAYSLLKLLPGNARISGGQIEFEGRNLASLDDEQLRKLRGARLGMMFQNPMTALDPVHRVGRQIEESLEEHLGLNRSQARAAALELLRSVAIPAPEQRIDAYPHELSGGMRQRVALAIAVACRPEILIADEPTTALDVTIQAQILQLIRTLLVEQQQAGVLLITHDLGVVAEVCDRVAVMYAGEIVEAGDVRSIFDDPRHPYTKALLAAAPSGDVPRGALATIPGRVPGLGQRPQGCRFRGRCAHERPVCADPASPPRIQLAPDREVACVLYSGQ